MGEDVTLLLDALNDTTEASEGIDKACAARIKRHTAKYALQLGYLWRDRGGGAVALATRETLRPLLGEACSKLIQACGSTEPSPCGAADGLRGLGSLGGAPKAEAAVGDVAAAFHGCGAALVLAVQSHLKASP